jgi:DNA helicase TIP49 (TBP-interacting protein)
MGAAARRPPMNFKTMAQTDVPQGRNGKHKEVINRILSDLDQVKDGIALRIPLADLAESKEKVRAALNRATKKSRRNIATASDADFLYVWNQMD